jgi:hypothetical protein
MATIKEDTIDDQRIGIDAGGLRRVRSFKFAGLLHGPNDDPLGEAYRMLQDRGIDYGEPHPVLNTISVVNIDGGHWNRTMTQAKLLVTYGVPQTGELSGQMSVTIVTSTARQLVRYDHLGNLITVEYVPGGAGAAVTSIGEVPKLVSHLILEFQYERGDPPPLDLAGTTNSTAWQGKAAGQWVCRECLSSRIMARTLWRTKASFEYDPQYWDKAAIYRDIFTGQIPKDVDPVVFTANSGNGWKREQVYDTYDFNSLNLPQIYPVDTSFNGSGF